MDALIHNVMPLYEREAALGRAVVLAVVVGTEGSTYGKRGTPLLVARGGDYAGLISGGCFEADLLGHAEPVFQTGAPRIVRYDMRGPDDELFGLGAGCEGAMEILLLRIGAETGWQPLAAFRAALARRTPDAAALVLDARPAPLEPGAVVLADADSPWRASLAAVAAAGSARWLDDVPGARVFALPLVLPPNVLLLGAGPDAVPVADFATRLGWTVTVYDHRPAFADARRFAPGMHVLHGRPEALGTALELDAYDAAVVMSHNLDADAAYLRTLAAGDIGYVGLLGPAPRRERLRTMLGAAYAALGARLRSPVGLGLGGRASASIALAIVAEIHAWLHRPPQERNP
jgi:xanthine/CO dehydrogenase XdhC/CoxF family maturation factor